MFDVFSNPKNFDRLKYNFGSHTDRINIASKIIANTPYLIDIFFNFNFFKTNIIKTSKTNVKNICNLIFIQSPFIKTFNNY